MLAVLSRGQAADDAIFKLLARNRHMAGKGRGLEASGFMASCSEKWHWTDMGCVDSCRTGVGIRIWKTGTSILDQLAGKGQVLQHGARSSRAVGQGMDAVHLSIAVGD